MKRSFGKFEYSKTMTKTSLEKKLVQSMSQDSNLERLLCSSTVESQQKITN